MYLVVLVVLVVLIRGGIERLFVCITRSSCLEELLTYPASLCLHALVFLQCLAMILFIVGMSAWSTDEENVSNTYWTYSESASENEKVTMYGLRIIVEGNTNNDDTSGHTSYSDCDDADYCKNCGTAGETALGMCLLAFFCLCPLVVTTGLRIMKKLDNKWLKLISIVLTAFVLFWSIVAVWNWQSSCVDRLPIAFGTNGYKNGPGYNCVVCNIFWMLLSLYFHVSTTSNVVAEDDTTNEPLTDQEGGSEEQDGGYMPAPMGDEKKNEV